MVLKDKMRKSSRQRKQENEIEREREKEERQLRVEERIPLREEDARGRGEVEGREH